MNLNKLFLSVILGGVFTGGTFYMTKMKNENINRSEVSMEYLKKHDTNKYIEILEKGLDKATHTDSKKWEQAAKEVQDSLRIDSIAKTNYAKGAQMVRDSIANANLKDVVKTVTKSVK